MNTNSKHCDLNIMDQSFESACMALMTIGIQEPDDLSQYKFSIALSQLNKKK